MRRLLIVFLVALAACRVPPPKLQLMSDDRKQFIHFMGHNQKLAFELQSETGEPLNQKAIESILDRMISNYEGARTIHTVADETYAKGLDEMFEYTIHSMRTVRSKAWTQDTVGEYFGIVEGACRACHDRFAP